MKIIGLFISAIIILFIACEIDHGLYPHSYKIMGTLITLRGEVPETTDRIEVYAIKEFPPTDPRNFLYLGQSGKLEYTNVDTIAYEIQVSPTRYDAIAVIWKEKGFNISLTGIVGIYTTIESYPLPVPVDVSREEPIADSVDIFVDWNKVSKDASISGTIYYEGNWPTDTRYLLLAVYRTKPTDDLSLLYFENLDYTQPIKVMSSEYRLLVNHGNYKYIVLFWIGETISKISDLVELGVYEDPANPGQSGVVELSPNEHATEIDIHVNFNEIQFP